MIQRSYEITDEAEFLWAIQTLKTARENDPEKTFFLQIFFSRFSKDEAKSVIQLLHKELPNVKIVGMSLYGDPVLNLNQGKFIKINFIIFSQSVVTLTEYDNQFIKIEDIIKQFRQKIASVKNVKGVLILGSGSTLKISSLIEQISEDFKDIHFFGTVANRNIADSFESYAVGTKIISRGIVAVIFSGESLEFYSESLFNWNPIGKAMEVQTSEPHKRSSAFISMMDRAKGLNLDQESENEIGDTIITTIDGIPATQIYKKYLNVDPDNHFISNICEFPLAIERNGQIMARVPCGYNEKGELYTIGDVKNGEKVRFTYAKTDELLQKSKEASKKMEDFYPEAVFLYICANRVIFMKDRSHEELDYYRKINPNVLYCHGSCEIHKYNEKGGVFNSQLVAIGMREGQLETVANFKGRSFSSQTTSIPFSFELEDSKKYNENISLNENSASAFYSEKKGFSQYTGTTLRQAEGTSIPLAERLVTFLEATTRDLKTAEENAHAASLAKSAFLSNISHEIRTPINAVLGLDEMISRESSEQTIKNYARDIQSSGRTLLSIINDILDFSKIEAGKMEIINADYDLRKLITDLANMIEIKAESRNLNFIVDVDEKMPHLLFGDENRIKQCALNILTNAVKYTPQGSVTLKVYCRKINESEILLGISVADTGIGIKKEDLAKLFSPFERIEENRNRNIEGTGLGMSIVKGLLSEMGSSLQVQSEYGKGSVFSFEIKQNVRNWEAIGTAQEAKLALEKEVEQYRESFQAPDARILVVDDTPINLTVFKGLLKNTRCKIDTANSCDEGVSLANQNKYDIIFADHLMPKKDGIQMLKELKETSLLNKETFCIVLTANAGSDAKEKYLQTGFTDYLSKPIDAKKLENMIASYLPKNLILKEGDDGFIKNQKSSWDGIERRTGSGFGFAGELITKILNIDISSALKNCGSKEVFFEAVQNFYDAIDEKSSLIEKYETEGDWNNYTIQVHALKSSAKLIGAEKLSELAKELEALGRNENAKDEIQKKTLELLKLYKGYKNSLKEIICENKIPESEKPELSKKETEEAFNSIREVVSSFDFNTADAIIKQMENYSVPKQFSEKYRNLKSAIQHVDQAEVMKILGE